MLGTLARYLEPDSPKLRTIFARLMDALLVPARQVQESVALCLPPLATLLKDCAMDELRRLFRSLPQAKKYAERVGFAYGVAGRSTSSLILCAFLFRTNKGSWSVFTKRNWIHDHTP